MAVVGKENELPTAEQDAAASLNSKRDAIEAFGTLESDEIRLNNNKKSRRVSPEGPMSKQDTSVDNGPHKCFTPHLLMGSGAMLSSPTVVQGELPTTDSAPPKADENQHEQQEPRTTAAERIINACQATDAQGLSESAIEDSSLPAECYTTFSPTSITTRSAISDTVGKQGAVAAETVATLATDDKEQALHDLSIDTVKIVVAQKLTDVAEEALSSSAPATTPSILLSNSVSEVTMPRSKKDEAVDASLAIPTLSRADEILLRPSFLSSKYVTTGSDGTSNVHKHETDAADARGGLVDSLPLTCERKVQPWSKLRSPPGTEACHSEEKEKAADTSDAREAASQDAVSTLAIDKSCIMKPNSQAQSDRVSGFKDRSAAPETAQTSKELSTVAHSQSYKQGTTMRLLTSLARPIAHPTSAHTGHKLSTSPVAIASICSSCFPPNRPPGAPELLRHASLGSLGPSFPTQNGYNQQLQHPPSSTSTRIVNLLQNPATVGLAVTQLVALQPMDASSNAQNSTTNVESAALTSGCLELAKALHLATSPLVFESCCQVILKLAKNSPVFQNALRSSGTLLAIVRAMTTRFACDGGLQGLACAAIASVLSADDIPIATLGTDASVPCVRSNGSIACGKETTIAVVSAMHRFPRSLYVIEQACSCLFYLMADLNCRAALLGNDESDLLLGVAMRQFKGTMVDDIAKMTLRRLHSWPVVEAPSTKVTATQHLATAEGVKLSGSAPVAEMQPPLKGGALAMV